MFELIDCATADIYGPYLFLSEAIARANAFDDCEIVKDGELVWEKRATVKADEAFIPH